MPNSSIVELPTLTRDTVNAIWFHVEVILDGPKETGYLPARGDYSFDGTLLLRKQAVIGDSGEPMATLSIFL
jgi:hypothetical protein